MKSTKGQLLYTKKIEILFYLIEIALICFRLSRRGKKGGAGKLACRKSALRRSQSSVQGSTDYASATSQNCHSAGRQMAQLLESQPPRA